MKNLHTLASTTTKLRKIMENTKFLTHQDFTTYLKSLETITDCNRIFTQDEVGPICEINKLDKTVEFGDYAIIDGWEYTLTYDQKEILEKFTWDNADSTDDFF